MRHCCYMLPPSFIPLSIIFPRVLWTYFYVDLKSLSQSQANHRHFLQLSFFPYGSSSTSLCYIPYHTLLKTGHFGQYIVETLYTDLLLWVSLLLFSYLFVFNWMNYFSGLFSPKNTPSVVTAQKAQARSCTLSLWDGGDFTSALFVSFLCFSMLSVSINIMPSY